MGNLNRLHKLLLMDKPIMYLNLNGFRSDMVIVFSKLKIGVSFVFTKNNDLLKCCIVKSPTTPRQSDLLYFLNFLVSTNYVKEIYSLACYFDQVTSNWSCRGVILTIHNQIQDVFYTHKSKGITFTPYGGDISIKKIKNYFRKSGGYI